MANIQQLGCDAHDNIYPIQFLEIGKLPPVPAPFLRIRTCGLLSIEQLEVVVSSDPPLAQYVLLPAHKLRGRGMSSALTLLKLLISRPHRHASKDWLVEHFRHEEEVISDMRLDNVASQLRSLFCPAGYDELRTHLLSYVHSSRESGNGYQLAAYPLIWSDVDALAWNVKQAARMDRFGDTSFPFWERAYQLASRGTYLPDEVYSNFSTTQREEVAGSLRQSVHALARLSLARHGQGGEEEALLRLRTYWLEYPTDEDVLRVLMELLGKQERYQEALEYYAKLEATLEEEGGAPDARTKDVAEYLRTKQIQRPPHTFVSTVQAESRNKPLSIGVTETNAVMETANLTFDPLKQKTLWQITTAFLDTADSSARESLTIADPEAWERLSFSITKSNAINAEVFSYFQKLLVHGWELSNVGELEIAGQVLSSFLPKLMQLASPQSEVAVLIAEGLRLRSILAAHQQRISDKLAFCLQAVEYARLSGNSNILVAELIELAVAFEYVQQQKNSFKVYQEALPLANQASPLIRSRLYGRSAIAFAKEGQTQEALFYSEAAYKNFPAHPEHETDFLSSDHGFHKLTRHKGLLNLVLGNPKEAIKTLDLIQIYPGPERSKLEILNDLGKTAIMLNDLEQYARCLKEGIIGSVLLKSKRRFDEVLQTFQQYMPQAWLHEPQIRQIVDQFQLPIVER